MTRRSPTRKRGTLGPFSMSLYWELQRVFWSMPRWWKSSLQWNTPNPTWPTFLPEKRWRWFGSFLIPENSLLPAWSRAILTQEWKVLLPSINMRGDFSARYLWCLIRTVYLPKGEICASCTGEPSRCRVLYWGSAPLWLHPGVPTSFLHSNL